MALRALLKIAPLLRWAKGLFVQDVPDDIALCEFDCRKQQCTMDEWATCGRRLTKAAGELSPTVQAGVASHKDSREALQDIHKRSPESATAERSAKAGGAVARATRASQPAAKRSAAGGRAARR
jgi:hypothetical protein